MNKSTPLILLAEDDPNDVFFMRRALQKAQIELPMQVVSDGQQAMDYLNGEGPFSDREQHPLPALMLLDLKMPFLDGFEVLFLDQLPCCVKKIPGGYPHVLG